MDPSVANQILDNSKIFKYSSLQYSEIDEILDFNILANDNNSILIIHNESDYIKLHWATNNIEAMINGINRIDGSLYIEFVPVEFIETLMGLGFIIRSEFIDFFNMNLEKTVFWSFSKNEINFMQIDECSKASQLTKDCENDSRGLHSDTAEWFSQWVSSEYGKVLVLKDQDEIFGLCSINLYGFEKDNGPILWIREIVVRPEYRGKGFGKKLLEQALAYGKENGAKRGFLLCDTENKKAIALYNKYGFYSKDERGQINMIKLIK